MKINNNESLHYSKPSQHSRNYTAIKSPDKRAVDRTQDFTPLRSNKKPSQRISELKNSINKCIEELSAKKEMNNDALKQVNDVNREIIEHLLNSASRTQGKTPRQTTREMTHRSQYAPQQRHSSNQFQQRQNVILSTFNINPTTQNQIQQLSPLAYQYQQFQNSQINNVPFAQSQSGVSQNELLMSKRAHNEFLQQIMHSLCQQNELLNSQRIVQSGSSTQLAHQLQQQNEQLRNELNQLSHINNKFNNAGYMNIYEQFQKLKDENQGLRRDTINLLQNKKH